MDLYHSVISVCSVHIRFLHSLLIASFPSQGSAARHRGDTRVAPDCGRIPLAACTSANQVDSLDTFRPPPWPLPYNDPQFSARTVQHPTVSGHDKASTHIQKPEQPTESKNADAGSTCTAHKVSETSAKQHSGGSRIHGIQFCDSSDNEDDCPICLEGWWKQLTLLSPIHKLFFLSTYIYCLYKLQILSV